MLVGHICRCWFAGPSLSLGVATMESLFSFQRIWVKLPRQASGECRCASAADGVPEADFPGCASNCCLFAAAEFGALETVTDLKALLAELLPSCFFTDYRLALYRGEGGGCLRR